MRVDTAAAVGKYIYMVLLREQTLLRQWGGIDGAPAGADTAAAVGKYWEGSWGSGHCCGSGEIMGRLLRERTLLRQWGNNGKAPAGADTAAAVGKYICAPAGAGTAAAVGKYWEGSCGSGHCCGSGGKQEAFLLEQTLLRQWGKYR